MWGILVNVGLWLLSRFLPSRDRELGRAEAENAGLKEIAKRINKADAAVRRNRSDPERLRRAARKPKR